MNWFLLILAVVGSSTAFIHSLITILDHLRNYRRPDLQRYTLRIIWMVPFYATACLVSLWTSGLLCDFIDAVRDVYEAIVIYSFFTLLVGYLGGERALLELLQNRLAVYHLFPLNLFFPPLEMRRPSTFLAVRRGILQFVVVKPILALFVFLLKALDTYNEGSISFESPYLWVTIIYNVSVMISLYCLAIFYVQCSEDLTPYKPIPKFFCVKALIFLTWYQGVAIAFLSRAGLLPDITDTSERGRPNHEALSALKFQNFLICLELPFLSKLHRSAFPWQEYACSQIKHTARIKFLAAVKDAFGVKDFVQDAYHTFIVGTTFSSGTTSEGKHLSSQFSVTSSNNLDNVNSSYFNDKAQGSTRNSRAKSSKKLKDNICAEDESSALLDDCIDQYPADTEFDADGDAVPDNLKRQAKRRRKKEIRRQRRILIFGQANESSGISDKSSANNVKVFGAGNFYTQNDFGSSFNNSRWWTYDENLDYYKNNAHNSNSEITEDPESIMNLLDWTDVEFSSPSSDPETEALYNYTKECLDFGDSNYPVLPDPYIGPKMTNSIYNLKSKRSRTKKEPINQTNKLADSTLINIENEINAQTPGDFINQDDEHIDPFADLYSPRYTRSLNQGSPSYTNNPETIDDLLTIVSDDPVAALRSAGNWVAKSLPIKATGEKLNSKIKSFADSAKKTLKSSAEIKQKDSDIPGNDESEVP